MIDALVKGVSVTYKCYEIIVINVSFPLNNTNVMFWHHCNNLYIFLLEDPNQLNELKSNCNPLSLFQYSLTVPLVTRVASKPGQRKRPLNAKTTTKTTKKT